MKKFYLIFILSSLFLNSFAQQLQWGKSTYGHGFDQVTSIVTTPTGNCLLSGTFKDSIDVDPNAGSVLCIPDTTAHVCAFIAEYDSNSNFLWKLEMIGPNIFPGRAICDASGNIYFGGTYKDSIHFQNTSYTLYGNLTKDVFFAKISPSGNLIWAKNITAPSPSSYTSFATTARGTMATNFIIYGSFGGTLDMDPGPGVYYLTAISSKDLFIASYDTAGTLQFAKSMPQSSGDNQRNSVWLSQSGSISICGTFYGQIDFDPSAGATVLSNSSATNDIFMAHYDPGGNLLWAKSFGGSGSDGVTSITQDSTGNTFISGYYPTSIDMDPSPNVSTLSGGNTFIGAYDTNGVYIWSSTDVDNGGGVYIYSITYLGNSLFITGSQSGIADYGTFQFSNSWSTECTFIGIMNSTGTLVSAIRFQPYPNSDPYTSSAGEHICVLNNSLYVAGEFTGAQDVNPDSLFQTPIYWAPPLPGNPNLDPPDLWFCKYDVSSFVLETEEINFANSLQVFPNPTSSLLQIANLENGVNQFTVIDCKGQAVYINSAIVENHNSCLDLSTLSCGAYILRIENELSIQINKPFIIAR